MDSTASGQDAIAIGPRALASGDKSIAQGFNATASATNAIAIGTNATASAANSVALGSNSVANGSTLSAPAYNPGGQAAGLQPVGEVSVGSVGGERRITNVAAGSADTDAVNVSQLRGLGANVLNQANSYADKIGKRAYAGVAAAMAMGEAPWVPGKWTAYEGVGYYQGQVAVGVSLRRTAHNGRWSIIGSASYSANGGGIGARIGATQILDWGDEE